MGCSQLFVPLGNLIAAGSLPPLAQDLAVCITAAAFLALACELVRLPHVLGFILAGVLVGPTVTGVVTETAQLRVVADLGIVLLLFVLGVELDLQGLRKRARQLIVVGTLQVPLTIGLAAGVAAGFIGVAGLAFDAYLLLYLSVPVAFSSTLLVVRELEHSARLNSDLGTLCVGMLIAQDLWALLIIATQPTLGSFGLASLAPVLGTAVLALLVFGPGRWSFAWFLRRVGSGHDVLVVVAMGWCLSWAIVAALLEDLSAHLPIALPLSSSAATGSFLAGMALGTLPRAEELVSRVVGTRDFFVAIFFVVLGLALPWPPSWASLGAAGAILLSLVLARAGIMWPLLRVTKTESSLATASTIQMSQVSEFGLVVAYLGYELGHIEAWVVEAGLVAFIVTALLATLQSGWARRWLREGDAGNDGANAEEPYPEDE